MGVVLFSARRRKQLLKKKLDPIQKAEVKRQTPLSLFVYLPLPSTGEDGEQRGGRMESREK